jgi:hypothetical protein
MLDEAVCKSLRETEHLAVSVTALCGLGELLDAQVPLVSSSPDERELIPKEKDNDARQERTSTVAVSDLNRQRGTVSGTAGGAAQ